MGRAQIQRNKQLSLDQYQNLDADTKVIVQLYALLGHACEAIYFARAFKEFKVLDVKDEVFTEQKISKIIEDLMSNGFMERRSKELICAQSLLHELRKQVVSQKKMLDVYRKLQAYYSVDPSYSNWHKNYAIRDLRLLLYLNQESEINKYFDVNFRYVSEKYRDQVWCDTIKDIPFDPMWIQSLSALLQHEIINAVYDNLLFEIQPCDDVINFMLTKLDKKLLSHQMLAEYYLLTGNNDKFLEEVEKIDDSYQKTALFADYLFCQNRLPEALKTYQNALKILRKNLHNNRILLLNGYHGVFYLLTSLICLGPQPILKTLERVNKDDGYREDLYNFRKLLYRIAGNSVEVTRLEAQVDSWQLNMQTLLSVLALFWLSPNFFKVDPKKLIDYFNRFATSGYKVFACICAEMLAKITPQASQYAQYVKQNSDIVKIRLTELITVRPVWEILLEQLVSASGANDETSTEQTKTTRLTWLLSTSEYASDLYILIPAEQEQAKNKSWKKPKHLALKKFYEEPPSCLSEQDKKIKDTILINPHSNYFAWNVPAMLKALVGHPFIYAQDRPDSRIELVDRNVHLLVTDTKDSFSVKLFPFAYEVKTLLLKETATRYAVVQFDAASAKLAKVIGANGLTLPLESKEKLLETVKNLAANVTIHSSFAVPDLLTQVANSKLDVQLVPYAKGLQANVVVRPFGDFGEVHHPGKGSQVIIAAHQMQKVQTVRDFEEEKGQYKQLLSKCRTLKDHIHEFQAIIEEPLECLKILSELKAINETITISWPRGEMMRVQANLTFDNLKLRVKKEQDWFSVEGDVIVDNQKFMSIKELLDLLDYNDNPFIPLSTDKFISLSEHFKQQLQKLKNTATRDDDGYHVHKLASYAVEEILGDCKNIELDAAWQEQIQKLSTKTKNTAKHKLPKLFKATLRPYQIEGFAWLAKMASWEIGACLADDMGLGKTVQTIALLLTRAPYGASLIVAPTSVCYNWIAEIQKFAPTLKTHLFAELIDREALLQSVAKHDVVICSYGLVQRNIGLLQKINWQVAVLDEAQAIKNSRAKRTKAIYQLQGNFRIALTGTPIENHLGELWSLFHYLNPGFLGSEESFFKRFIVPIEQHKNEYARTTLRNLIKPFILRRMKEAVLKELPPKTETTIMVELSEEERAFYEGLRVRAVENIANTDPELTDGQQHFKILAEITKLRLACCHTTLVYDDIDLPSSKLQQFSFLIDEILENKHRVLVFSQFVRYLSLIKKMLDEKGISYQYLDGQTPQTQRKIIIENFQQGKTEIFLLSLKAGGVGLNLTAADYVILLDPWWNPAVENQATDRAHRIGQTKPVNIYRLINKQTIEEKILQLHQTKKDLANDLLSDSDMSGKLTTKELLQLIHGK